MKLDEIPFEDEAFKAAVLATGETEAEAVTVVNGRRQSIKSVKGIEYLPNLKVLDVTRNKIATIDVSANPKLEQLFIGNNQLESLDVSALQQLEGLEIFMNDIAELDLSHNPRLEVLYANANDFDELDLSANSELIEVLLSDNSLKQIKLPEGASFDLFNAENNLFSDDDKLLLAQQLQQSGCQARL